MMMTTHTSCCFDNDYLLVNCVFVVMVVVVDFGLWMMTMKTTKIWFQKVDYACVC